MRRRLIGLLAASVTILCASGHAASPAPQDQPNPLIVKAEAFVQLLAAQEFAKAVGEFDPAMKAALSETQLRGGWAGVITKMGAFKQRVASRGERRGDMFTAQITIEFERGRMAVQLVYNATGQVAGLSIRPLPPDYVAPSYAKASAYVDREVVVGGPTWPLPGTLTLPAGATRVPAVVLVHGSGPGDRDQTVGAAKPFRDLALGLASHGVAVLSYDKRSRVFGDKLSAKADLTVRDEVIDDVLAAVELLRTDPAIDPTRIVVLGHSLGGMLIPRIAAADRKIAGFIVMAGPTRPVEELILEQTLYLSNADGVVTPAEQQVIDSAKKMVADVRAVEATTPGRIGGAPASYWIDLRGYDPPAAAKLLGRPLLILQGERDYQVTMVDFERWKAALGGESRATLRSYPGLNHLFIAGTGASVAAEYAVPGHVAESVVTDIAAWVRAIKI